MITFTPVTLNDIEQIADWIAQDPYHQGQPALWWLGDGAVLASCITDDEGPLTYIRFDAEGEYVRLHTQFAPREVVSRKRLVACIQDAMRTLKVYFLQQGKKGIIFESVSPALIAFMTKYEQFEHVGGNDYRYDFEGN